MKSTVPKKLSFQSNLEKIAVDMNYFAVPVPEKVTRALQTKGPVPVSAQINGSETFLASLYPVGGGRHYLRVRNKICGAVGIAEGSRVRVKFTVRDRAEEIGIPRDLASALRAERMTKAWEDLPVGQRSFILRKIAGAAKPETRVKRIQAAIEAAQSRRERKVDRAR